MTDVKEKQILFDQPRSEPLLPQPHAEPFIFQYWGENGDETEEWFGCELDDDGYPVFWDFPNWSEDISKINGVWCWV